MLIIFSVSFLSIQGPELLYIMLKSSLFAYNWIPKNSWLTIKEVRYEEYQGGDGDMNWLFYNLIYYSDS